MDIPGAFASLSQSFGEYYDDTCQNAMAATLKIKKLRNDTEFFYKVCQVAYASLQLIMLNYLGTIYLNRVANVFNLTATMHDFYRFIQQPRQWFFPVDAASINAFAVLDDLTDFIYKEIGPEEIFDPADDEADPRVDDEDKAELRKLLKACLTEQLESMSENKDAYRDVGEFFERIEIRLKKFKEDKFDKYAFSTHITLEKLQRVKLDRLNENNHDYCVSQWRNHIPLLERITNGIWATADVECVLSCIREWGWLNKQGWEQLDSFLLGTVCTGFFFKLLEAGRKLFDENLTEQAKEQAQRDAITAFAELFYFIAVYYLYLAGKLKENVAFISVLAIGAKTIGLVEIATRGKTEYFQEA